MASSTLQFVIKIKDTATAGIKAVTKSMADLSQAVPSVRKAFESLKPVGKNLDGIAGSVLSLKSALAGVGVGAAFREVISTFSEFDDKIRQAGAVSGATGAQMAELTDIARKMGAETAFTASQAAEALTKLSMAGFSVKDSVAALPKTLQLASAGALDLATAADISTNIMAAYGFKADELGYANDVLVKGFTSTNATLEELGTAFAYVGPIAKGVGSDFENLVGTLGALHSAGIKGSMAGTTLRGVIDALFNPTKDEAELMAELSDRIGGAGLEITNVNGDFVGFTDLVRQMEEAGLTAAEALRLFGQRAGPGMQALLGQGSDALEALDEKLGNAGGTAERIATEMEAGVGGAIRTLISAFDDLKIEIGKSFEGTAIKVIKYFTEEIRKASKTVTEWKTSGKIDEWAAAFSAAIKLAWGYVKDFAATVLQVWGFLKSFASVTPSIVSVIPAVVALSVAWLALSKATHTAVITFGIAKKILGAEFIATLGMSKLQMIAHTAATNSATASMGLFKTILIEAQLALAKMAAVGAAAFVGWKVGEWINTWKVFGDGTVSVGQKVQNLYAKMFGAPDSGALNMELDRLKNKFAEFKDFTLPEDFASASTAELQKMNGALQQSRGYWELVKKEQEQALQSAIETSGKNSAEAQKWQRELEFTAFKLGAVKIQMGKLAAVDGAFDKQVAEAKKAQGDLVKLVKDLGKHQIAEIRKTQQAELDDLEKLVQTKAVTLEGAEKLRIAIIEKYAPKIREQQIKMAEDVARAEMESRIELLTMRRDQDLKLAASEIKSASELAYKKMQIEATFAENIDELKAKTEEKIQKQTAQILKKSKEEVKDRVKIQEAAEAELLAVKAAALADVDRLEARGLENSRGLAEIEMAFHKSKSEKRLGLEAEVERIRTQISREAIEKRLEIEEEALARQLTQAKEYASEMAENTATGSEERAAAIKKIQDLELELVAFQTDKAKQLADIEIAAAEASKQRKEDAITAETDFRKAEYEKQIAAIELEEAKGYLSVEDATRKKMEAEKTFTQYRIDAAIAAADRAAEEYGRDSAAYQNAVAEKLQAQAQLAGLETAIRELGTASEEMAAKSEEASEKMQVSFSATGQQIDRVTESARQFGTTALFSVDETRNTLADLGKIMESNYKTIALFAGTISSAYANVAGEQNAQIEEMIGQFKAIANSAEEAGLSVNLMDMTLEEAAQSTAARVEAYRAFKDEIIGLKEQFQTLEVRLTGVEEIDVAREKFQAATVHAAGLGEKILELNTAFGSGDIETAEKMADEVIDTYEEIYTSAKAYLEQLKAEWQSYADKVTEIQNQIEALNQSVEEKIREARRKTMTEAEEWQDRRLEYEEIYAEAVRLSNAGLAEESTEMFKKAIELAAGLQQAVRDESGETVATMEENTTLSISLMEKARAAAEGALTNYKSSLISSQEGIQATIQANTLYMHQFAGSINAAVDSAEKLKGTMGGFSGGGPILGFGMAGGGTFPRRPHGRLPGIDTGKDEIPVMARRGEWFIRNEAANYWSSLLGGGFMHGINAPWSAIGQRIKDSLVPGYAVGGAVGGSPSVDVRFPEMESYGSFTINGKGGSVRAFGPKDAVRAVIREAEKERWLRTQ